MAQKQSKNKPKKIPQKCQSLLFTANNSRGSGKGTGNEPEALADYFIFGESVLAPGFKGEEKMLKWPKVKIIIRTTVS